jgi:Type 9 secretion system plug protein 1st domain
MKKFLSLLFLLPVLIVKAQLPDHIYNPNIHAVKLYKYGDMYSYPVITLNGSEQLELHFDDMDADVKNYYYTYQLCNADWSPASLQPYDYIRGFQTNRISTYRNSSIAYTRYTHYQLTVPDRNSTLSRSGNYLLKVFLNDDTSKLVFTKRFLVVDNKSSVSAQVQQPFNVQFFKTHQRLQVAVNTANAQINTFSPQDLKVVIVQNNAWPAALMINRPTIFRGNYFEYSDEDATTFPAGKEWRWIDLRSLRLMSDRMLRIVDTSKRTDVYVKPDGERGQQLYVYYHDLDGIYTIENADGYNPYWQSDYAYVHFSFFPAGNRPYEGKSIYLFGELTNYSPDDFSKMIFNADKGAYEKTLFLKQGYYNYSYVTMTDKKQPGNTASFENTEGNYWGTENSYMVMVYLRPFGARADELIGFTRLSSIFQR